MLMLIRLPSHSFELGDIDRALEVSTELRQAYENDEVVKKLIDMATPLKAYQDMPYYAAGEYQGLYLHKVLAKMMK